MELKKLTNNHLNDILELQHDVYESLADKEVLETLGEAEFRTIIGQGFIIGYFDEDRLVATRSMYIPDIDEDGHLSDDVDIDDKLEVIYSEISFISPEYRGMGLHTKMGWELLSKVREDGRFKYCLTTVMPSNIPSLKDKFKLGFKIMATRYKYGGKLRHILVLDLERNTSVHGGCRKVHYMDTGWMLTNGDDYIGVSLKEDYIHYYKK